MQYIRLGDIASIAAGQGAPQGAENYSEYGTPFVKAGNLAELTSGTSEDAIQKVSDEVAAKHKLKLFPQGTVLFAKSGMSCMKGYVYTLSRDCYVVSHLACITPHTVESEYLKYYFEFHRPNQLVKDAAYPSISLSDIAELPIAVFDQEKRQEIIHNLDVVSGLIEKKQQILSLMDLAVKSRFIELFGDPEINPYGWEQVTVEDVCTSIVRGPFGSALKKEFFVEPDQTTYKVYEQKHAIQKSAVIGTYYVSAEKYNELRRFECHPGDILMSCSGTMGELYQLPPDSEKGIINQALCKFTLNSRMLPIAFLAYMKETIGNLETKGSGIQNIAAVSYVKAMPINLPPMTVQNQFAAFVEQTDKSKFFACQTLSFLLKLANNLQSWREKQYDY